MFKHRLLILFLIIDPGQTLSKMTGSGEDEPEPVGEAEEGPGIVHVGQEPEGAAAHRCPQHAKYKHPECSIGLLCTACRLLPGLLNPNNNGVKYS